MPRGSRNDHAVSPMGPSVGPPARAVSMAVVLARMGVWLATVGLLVTLAAAWLWPALQTRALWPIEVVNYLAFAIRTLSFHMGLGVLGMIVVALMLRQWRLAAFVLLPTACFLLPPDAVWIARAAPPAAASVSAATGLQGSGARPEVIVYSHNAFLGKIDVNAIARTAREHDADIIVIQEATTGIMRQLRRALGGDYPHVAREDQSALYGHAVFSRHPFAEPSRPVSFVEPPPVHHPYRMHAGDPQQRVVIQINDRQLVIQNIHLVSPANPEAVAEQGRQVGGLIGSLAADQLLGEDSTPTLIIGDFNSTPRSATHGRLRAAGLREMHAAVGTSRGGTWPAHSRWVPKFLSVRIDNAWINQSIAPRFSTVIAGHGSDHRGVIVGFDLKN